MGTEVFNRQFSENYHSEQVDHEKRAMECRNTDDGAVAPMPYTIALAVNNRCFLKCLHCDVGEARRNKEKRFFYQRVTGGETKKNEIPLIVLKKLVDDVCEYKPIIRPTFLEPLLRKDLFGFADYVKSKGLTFNLQTNGVMLPKRSKEIIDSKIDIVRVSIDGPRHVHDYLRGVKGVFDKAISGLQEIIKLKRKYNLEKPVLGISYCVSGINYHEIVNFMDQLHEMGVLDHVYVAFGFLRFITQAEADAFNELTSGLTFMTESSKADTGIEDINIDVLIKEIERLYDKYPPDQYHYYFNPSQFSKQDIYKWFKTDEFLRPESVCHVPWSHCQILYNGDVVVNGRCCSPSFGNIYNQSFPEIWNSDIAKSFRRTLVENRNFAVCNRCCRKFDVSMLEE
jgi:Fe-coproporphyrin III synthase